MKTLTRKDAKKKLGILYRSSAGGNIFALSNTTEVLTLVPDREKPALPATRDPYDRAHNQRNPTDPSMLVPAGFRGRKAANVTARPRRYHRSQMTSRGVGFDSMFDDWWQVYLRLASGGVELGTFVNSSDAAAVLRGRFDEDEIRIRDLLHQRTRQSGMTAEEVALEREASRMLAEDAT